MKMMQIMGNKIEPQRTILFFENCNSLFKYRSSGYTTLSTVNDESLICVKQCHYSTTYQSIKNNEITVTKILKLIN